MKQELEDTIAKIRNEQTRVRCVLHILKKKQLKLAFQRYMADRIVISAVPETSTKPL